MERLLVVWCPELTEEHEDGRRARAFAGVLAAVGDLSPAVAVVRPGVCAVPTRGPSRYFGGDDRLARRVLESPVPASAGPLQVGVADGLFAAMVAARAATSEPLVVPPGGTPAFLGPWPVDVLGHPELTDLLPRLGVRTLRELAALPARHVLARFGALGAACHAVAAGTRGELPGLRVVPRTRPLGRDDAPAPPRQPGFWAGAAAAEARAERVVARAAELLPPASVVVGRLQGGRAPAERARLVPWEGRRVEGTAAGSEPWPGRIPSPAPALVFARPIPAVLAEHDGQGVGVGADGMVSAAPARLSVSGGPWTAVTAWAGPWPADVRWWSQDDRRRQARMQVVTDTGAAWLLVREGGGWWVEGAYD